MWKILLPSGEFLDTPTNFSLQFELNNQVFSTSNTSVLPGSFTFPVEVPLTGRMRAQLDHPYRVDNEKNWQPVTGVWAYAYGAPMFYGTLTITDADPGRVRISIVANPLGAFKGIYLNELDFEGERTVPGGVWEDYMKATIQFPEDYDHAFLPATNENPFYNFNAWNSTTQEFVLSASLATPFVKLKYLLERMWAADPDGFGFNNAWQGTDLELGRLYLFNNVDSRIITSYTPHTLELPDTFSLNKHVPAIKCSELLKKITSQWCLGFFTNVFDRKVRLLSLQEVLSRAPRQDWTAWALDAPVRESGTDVAGYYNYDQTTALLPDMPALESMTVINTIEEYLAGTPWAQGYYYVESNNIAFYVNASGFARTLGRYFRGVRPGAGEDYKAGMEALHDQFDAYLTQGEYSGWHEVEGSSPLEYEWKENDYPIALMAYRGLQDYVIGGGQSPVSCNTVWLDGVGSPGDRLQITTDGDPGPAAKRSLNWFGEYGLYNTAHRTWAEMLIQGKHASQSFALPMSVLTGFSFEDKVRVGNMDYFVKKLRVRRLLGRGRVLVDASMVTVI